MNKSDAFQIHVAGLIKGSQSLNSLYVFSGDEPLLMMEAVDSLRAFAKTQGFTDSIYGGSQPTSTSALTSTGLFRCGEKCRNGW